MRRDKLQMYVDLLACLSDCKEKGTTHIVYESNVNMGFAAKALDLAVKREEVKETKRGHRSVYVIANRGLELVNESKPYKEFSEKLEAAVK